MNNEILDYIEKCFVQTGSRVWGVHTEFSDWDYFTNNNQNIEEVKEMLERDYIDYYHSPIYDSIKFELDGKVIDLIWAGKEFNGWVYATRAMQNACKTIPAIKDLISMRHVRVDLFRSIVNAVMYRLETKKTR